ncbi:hypothetical protein V5049_11985 [Moellerella wisconsensis]|uniref:hypothetical protein n=1 Tax=Moellerella wisconsensis TaxID=158849 RepID=UPI003076153A
MGIGFEVYDAKGRYKTSSRHIVPRLLMYGIIRTDSASGTLKHPLMSAGGRIVASFQLVQWNGDKNSATGGIKEPNEFSKYSISGDTLTYDLKYDGTWGGSWGTTRLYRYIKYKIFAL